MEKFGKFIALLLLAASHYVVMGVVTHYFWNWFVAPLVGTGAIGIVQAIGLVIFANFLLYKRKEDEDKSFNEVVESVVHSHVAALFILCFGYVIHLFL